MNGKQRHRLGEIGRMAASGKLDGAAVRKAIEEVLSQDYARTQAAVKAAKERGVFVQGLDDRDDDHILGEYSSLADIWPPPAFVVGSSE
jgi:hypothetical protein